MIPIDKTTLIRSDNQKLYRLRSSVYELHNLALYHFQFLYNIRLYQLPSITTSSPLENHIFNLFTDSPFRNVLLHYQRLINSPYIQKLEFYTDGSLIDLGSPSCSMSLACIQTSINAPRFEVVAKIKDWPSSTRAEVAAILIPILIAPPSISIDIFTDSQASIDAFNSYHSMNFPLTSRQYFKIATNNNLWATMLSIIDINQLDINLIKVKAHDTNPYNNEVDRLARESHTSDYIVEIIDRFNPCLSYTPLWNGIKIEKHLRHFITDVSWNRGFEQFYNLFRNAKYRNNNIKWDLTFSHLNDDGSSTITSLPISQKKAHRIKFLVEELPTIEHMKKRRYDLYEHSKCPQCKYCVETFVHVFTCTKSKNIVENIRNQSQELLVKLIYDHANTKVPLTSFTDLQEIWNLDHRPTDKLTFIDIIKGFVPLILFDKVQQKVKHQEMTSLIVSIFMNFIYENICELVWFPRCQLQIDIEKRDGIDTRIKKQKNITRNKLPRIAIDSSNSFSSITHGQLGVLNSIRMGNNWSGFMMFVNWLLCCSGGMVAFLVTLSGP